MVALVLCAPLHHLGTISRAFLQNRKMGTAKYSSPLEVFYLA